LAAEGSTIIFSTHVMAHAERICDRILLIAKGQKIFDGTIPEAQRTIPNRVRINAVAEKDQLQQLPGVLSVTRSMDDERANGWELGIADGADPQGLLQACFERGITLTAFDHHEPTLHDVFVQLVGDEAREAQKR